jgi:hypothetical protein
MWPTTCQTRPLKRPIICHDVVKIYSYGNPLNLTQQEAATLNCSTACRCMKATAHTANNQQLYMIGIAYCSDARQFDSP